jgi:hypothetical protein
MGSRVQLHPPAEKSRRCGGSLSEAALARNPVPRDLGARDGVHVCVRPGGLVLTGKAAVLKTAGRKPIGVRIPGPPLL